MIVNVSFFIVLKYKTYLTKKKKKTVMLGSHAGGPYKNISDKIKN